MNEALMDAEVAVGRAEREVIRIQGGYEQSSSRMVLRMVVGSHKWL